MANWELRRSVRAHLEKTFQFFEVRDVLESGSRARGSVRLSARWQHAFASLEAAKKQDKANVIHFNVILRSLCHRTCFCAAVQV